MSHDERLLRAPAAARARSGGKNAGESLRTAARLAAAVAAAPVALVCHGGLQATEWVGGLAGLQPDGWAAETVGAALLGHVHGEVLVTHSLATELGSTVTERELGGLGAAICIPLGGENDSPAGFIAVLDREPRWWTSTERDRLADLVSMVRTGASDYVVAASAVSIAEVAERAAHAMVVATGGLDDLVASAAASSDVELRRRAGQATHHLRQVRTLSTRVRSALQSSPIASHAAPHFDVRTAAGLAARDACAGLGFDRMETSVPDQPLPVSGDGEVVRGALRQLISSALLCAGPENVSVRVTSESVASESLHGSLTAQVTILVGGAPLGIVPITRAAGALMSTASQRSSIAPTSIRMMGDEFELFAPGLRANTNSHGSCVTLRWPVDLG